jgi:hypothetical protein
LIFGLLYFFSGLHVVTKYDRVLNKSFGVVRNILLLDCSYLIFTISAVSININGIFSLFTVNYGVKTAKAKERKGCGRKFQLTKAQIAMQNSDTGIEELGVTILTVNRYVGSTRAQVNGFDLILLITLYCAVLDIFLSHFKFQWQDLTFC